MKQVLVFSLLVAVGTVQWLGDVLDVPALKRLGFASHASPAPRVFTSQAGFETFANRFHVVWHDEAGRVVRTELTPERYDMLRGAYNRRNVYGAAFSYGPVLAHSPATREMYMTVLHRATCGKALQEIGIPLEARRRPITVLVVPHRPSIAPSSLPMSQTLRCQP